MSNEREQVIVWLQLLSDYSQVGFNEHTVSKRFLLNLLRNVGKDAELAVTKLRSVDSSGSLQPAAREALAQTKQPTDNQRGE